MSPWRGCRHLTGAGYRRELVDGAIERLTSLRYLDDGAFAGCMEASATVTATATGLPATFSAIDAIHAFCSSHCIFAFFWLGRNANVT